MVYIYRNLRHHAYVRDIIYLCMKWKIIPMGAYFGDVKKGDQSVFPNDIYLGHGVTFYRYTIRISHISCFSYTIRKRYTYCYMHLRCVWNVREHRYSCRMSWEILSFVAFVVCDIQQTTISMRLAYVLSMCIENLH